MFKSNLAASVTQTDSLLSHFILKDWHQAQVITYLSPLNNATFCEPLMHFQKHVNQADLPQLGTKTT
ncbi:hypothetical protein E2C01_037583 [Portunus trituberculatus]|uniref:Uncharacterized protein n=1 Tax=Portunus trituberculatus TaxID=210409 RepID=A0A5B7FEZ6_PORTR|nr:hypothetical protein [Portunus trituberculatus]